MRLPALAPCPAPFAPAVRLACPACARVFAEAGDGVDVVVRVQAAGVPAAGWLSHRCKRCRALVEFAVVR